MEDGETPENTYINSENAETVEKKKPLNIDFAEVFASSRDEIPAEIVVVPADSGQRHRKKKRKKPVEESASGSASCSGGGDDLSGMSEIDINAAIERNARTLANCKLPDNGEKLKAYSQRLEDELKRRKLRKSQEDDLQCKKPAHSDSASVNGALDGLARDVQSSQAPERSKFASCFMKKLEDNVKPKSEQNTGDQANNAFNHEISYLNHCDKRKKRSFAPSLQSKKAKSGLCSKEFSAWKPRNGYYNSEKYRSLFGNLTGRAFSTANDHLSKEKEAGSFTIKDASPARNFSGVKNDQQTVVLVDEEEAELVESKQEAEQLPSSTKEGKIYYPSREDPESLEIFRSELKCLEPGECLTSTIMNFYIRFLQESSSERSLQNVYFFNTYFYSKLQEAVAYQKSDKEAFFVKFRRWWRGVNIFQKAYIFLPINEDKHWSLVIICIPDREDESGPIVLHLDSLGLHCSPSIFRNIRSLLKNERNFLSEDGSAFDIPISDRIWRFLDRRIDERIMPVPRQTNDYDCGLFVLYYMERFIEEAPVRLKRQHLDNMFGRSWFKPQEASSLRGKIKKILEEEFHKALKENDSMWQPVCLTANAEAAKP